LWRIVRIISRTVTRHVAHVNSILGKRVAQSEAQFALLCGS
jgi:hypothetical protein